MISAKEKKAFKLLGLPTTASSEEINRAFKRLTKKTHPDTAYGSTSAQAKLNRAKEIALAYAEINSSALTLISSNELSKIIDKAVSRLPNDFSRNSAHTRLKRQTDHIKIFQWMSWLIGGCAGLIALIDGNIGGLFPISSEQEKIIKPLLALFTLVFGLAGFVLQFFIRIIETRLDRFLDSISDIKICAEKLARLLNYKDHASIDKGMLRCKSNEGNSTVNTRILHYIGDESTIVFEKSLELGLLRLEEADDIGPDHQATYSVTFKPSRFKP